MKHECLNLATFLAATKQRIPTWSAIVQPMDSIQHSAIPSRKYFAGITGYLNSCYIDVTLLSLFAFNSQLYNEANQAYNKCKTGNIPYIEMLPLQILYKEILPLLKQRCTVPFPPVRDLRVALATRFGKPAYLGKFMGMLCRNKIQKFHEFLNCSPICCHFRCG